MSSTPDTKRLYRITQIVDGKTAAVIVTDNIAEAVNGCDSNTRARFTCKRLMPKEVDAWNEQQQRLWGIGAEIAAEDQFAPKTFAVTFRMANDSTRTSDINIVAQDLPATLLHLTEIGVNLSRIVSICETGANAARQPSRELRTVETGRCSHDRPNSDDDSQQSQWRQMSRDDLTRQLQKMHDAIQNRHGVSKWSIRSGGRAHSFAVERREDGLLYPTERQYVDGRELIAESDSLVDIALRFDLNLSPDRRSTNRSKPD